MPGKCRPSLRDKTLENVMRSSLSSTDKECIKAVFERYEAEPVKHGRWLQPKSGECFCSECQTNGSPQWKRCPVCEAKMNGGENDA